MKNFLKMCRVHQWSKNVLLFVPLLASRQYADLDSWVSALLAFCAFCLCASSIYIQNDLLDRRADRVHSKKRFRPIASGVISPKFAVISAIVLLVLSMWLAGSVSRSYLLLLVVYFQLSSLYSLFFKRIAFGDVVFLAGLYVVRILGGGFAVGVDVSIWLLLVSGFFFASLAFLKRYIECSKEDALNQGRRAYKRQDTLSLLRLGGASGFMSLLIFFVYSFSMQAGENYKHPFCLWLVIGLVGFWLCRLWKLALAGKVHHDPVVFALKDLFSYLMVMVATLVLLLAK